jgi:hypothetical protein
MRLAEKLDWKGLKIFAFNQFIQCVPSLTLLGTVAVTNIPVIYDFYTL